jgi:hypothetical protein
MVPLDSPPQELTVSNHQIAREKSCVITFEFVSYVSSRAMESIPARADLQASVP